MTRILQNTKERNKPGYERVGDGEDAHTQGPRTMPSGPRNIEHAQSQVRSSSLSPVTQMRLVNHFWPDKNGNVIENARVMFASFSWLRQNTLLHATKQKVSMEKKAKACSLLRIREGHGLNVY